MRSAQVKAQFMFVFFFHPYSVNVREGGRETKRQHEDERETQHRDGERQRGPRGGGETDMMVSRARPKDRKAKTTLGTDK